MRRISLWTIAAFGVAACAAEDSTGDPAYHRPVVIQALLIGNQPLQTLTILWVSTNDDPRPTDGPAPTDVRLWIVSPAGDSTPLVATGANGTFTAALTPLPGATYRLVGTILDSTVLAQTTLPSALHLAAPGNGDTVTAVADPFSVADGITEVMLRAEVVATGAFGYAEFADFERGALVVSTSGGMIPSSWRSTNGVLPPLNTSFGVQDTTVTGMLYRISAFDANATTFYQPGSSTSTVRGALGLFGSALADSAQLVIVR